MKWNITWFIHTQIQYIVFCTERKKKIIRIELCCWKTMIYYYIKNFNNIWHQVQHREKSPSETRDFR